MVINTIDHDTTVYVQGPMQWRVAFGISPRWCNG